MNRREFALGLTAMPAIASAATTAPAVPNGKTIGRLSTDAWDRGYQLFKSIAPYGGVVTRLNGEIQTHVFTADDREGFVTRGVLDYRGQMYIEPGTDRVAMETVFGHVSFDLSSVRR